MPITISESVLFQDGGGEFVLLDIESGGYYGLNRARNSTYSPCWERGLAAPSRCCQVPRTDCFGRIASRSTAYPRRLDATYTHGQNGLPNSLEVTLVKPEKQVPEVVERVLTCTTAEASLGFLLAELVRGNHNDR